MQVVKHLLKDDRMVLDRGSLQLTQLKEIERVVVEALPMIRVRRLYSLM